MIILKKLVPELVLNFFRPPYHLLLSLFASLLYGRPSRKMTVIGVTGTNGKTSVVEFSAQILKEAGIKAASVSSLYFRAGNKVQKNTLKMTMPGRFFLQKFLRLALDSGCTHVILEVTSEGIKQFRHKNIDWDILVFTNLTPEHIESHGSFESYRKAKEKVFAGLIKTYRKKNVPKTIIVNGDDPTSNEFLKYEADKKIIYSSTDAPRNPNLTGKFNLYNLASAVKIAEILGVSPEIIRKTAEKVEGIPGRMEFIQREPFVVIVDYAHTPDALRKVYQTLKIQDPSPLPQTRKLICVLGSAGGGRDKWKRPEIGKIAGEFCNEVILTNEDSYEENPEDIINEIAKGLEEKLRTSVERSATTNISKIIDRSEAIGKAIRDARSTDVVIITGKGAEPWMMGPNGTKIPWDDREEARSEIKKLSGV